MSFIIISILGWAGMVLIVAAYYLVSVRKLSATSLAYQLLNLIGAVGVGVHVYNQKAWAALTLEVIWAAIAIYTLLKRN